VTVASEVVLGDDDFEVPEGLFLPEEILLSLGGAHEELLNGKRSSERYDDFIRIYVIRSLSLLNDVGILQNH
jgi:hypothetical protein